MRMLVAIGIIILANCYSTFAGKNPMSSADDIERMLMAAGASADDIEDMPMKAGALADDIESMSMTAGAPPGNNTGGDASFGELPDTTTKRKILNCLNVRIM